MRWWIMLSRFARWQTDKYRAIDDGKSSGTNTATVLQETIVCPAFDFALFVARGTHTVATIHSMDTPALTIALHDLTAAYRFVASAHPQYGTFLIWNPAAERARLEYYFMPGHPFGLTSSVVNFNRCSEAITAVARAHGIVVDHYFDDFMILDTTHGKGTATLAFEAIVRHIGSP